MSFDDDLSLVIDTGSRFTKAGFGGEHFPRTVFPTTIGSFRHKGILDGRGPYYYIGHEAIKQRGISNLSWPVQEGLVKNWDEMEKLWFHIYFQELNVPPESTKVLHVVHPLIPEDDRKKMAEIFFESFAISALNLMKAPVLALHASGRTTGVVYENGAQSSYVSPVLEGFPLRHTTTSCELTGEALSDRLREMLRKIGYLFATNFEQDLLDEIKAKFCYVAKNYKDETEKHLASGENRVQFTLPDGQHILIGDERFKVAETLFQPSLFGLTCPSIVDYICESIQKCDIDIRNKLFENIVTSGGAIGFPGFATRLVKEMSSRVKLTLPEAKMNVKVDDLPKIPYAPWIGGSIIASMDSLKEFWMTRQDYEDTGSDRINYKFF